MTDKITVELDRELAERFIKRTANYDGPFVRVRNLLKAALPPEWEEGTLAWLESGHPGHRALCVMRGGKWLIGDHIPTGFDPIKVEPIRVLKDDEVAVKRADWFASPASARHYARTLRERTYHSASELVEAYADALEAEK